jgi:O-antigen ligase
MSMLNVAEAARLGPRPRTSFTTTELTDWALCFFSFAILLAGLWATPIVGQATVNLLFILPWVWIFARNANAASRSVLSNWPVLVLPLLAVLSTLWSDYPGTLKSSAQYLVTAIIGVLAATCIKPRIMLGVFFWVLLAVTVIGVPFGLTEVRGDEVTLVGLFGSKNYFGYSVGLLLLTAVIFVFDKSRPPAVRWTACAAVAVSPVLLVLSRSTGALVFSITALIITGLLGFIIRFSPVVRFALLLLISFSVALLMIFFVYVVDFDTLLGALGKDVTLTGRTWLWEMADKSIAENPVLGVSYGGYWREGSWGAEEIWLHELKADKTGFHFHNTFRQVAVDLGFTGLFVLLATLAAICIRIGTCLLFSRPDTEQVFAIAMFLFLLLRLPIEVDLFWAFQIPTITLSMVWVYLGLPGRRKSGRRNSTRASASVHSRHLVGPRISSGAPTLDMN